MAVLVYLVSQVNKCNINWILPVKNILQLTKGIYLYVTSKEVTFPKN